MKILMTGATGAIGIPLIQNLLEAGADISIIARPKPKNQDFMSDVNGRISIIPGDVTEPMCGILRSTIETLGAFDVFIHAAGKVQYHEHLREETYRVNKTGTENAINLARELKIRRFLFISTCYVAGNKAYLDETESGHLSDANNPYESSKMEAEALVQQRVIRPVILRLGTVIGHGQTGKIINVGGYAGFVRGLWVIRNRLLRFPNNPFWLAINPESTLNLIQNDWVVDHIRKAAFSDVVGTFHLSHTNPVSLGWLFHETIGKWLKVPLSYDRSLVEKTALYKNAVWRDTQELITRGIVGYFGPYVAKDSTFGHTEVKKIPGYVPPPLVSEKVVAAQMDYMINCLFHKKKAR